MKHVYFVRSKTCPAKRGCVSFLRNYWRKEYIVRNDWGKPGVDCLIAPVNIITRAAPGDTLKGTVAYQLIAKNFVMLSSNSPFFLTDIVAGYMRQRFWWHITEYMRQAPAPFSDKVLLALPSIFPQNRPGPVPPYSLKPSLVNEIEHMASVAAQAYITHGSYFFA